MPRSPRAAHKAPVMQAIIGEDGKTLALDQELNYLLSVSM